MHMANLQVKNVPETLHRKIRTQAQRQGRTVRDFVLQAVIKEIERGDFRTRLARRKSVDLKGPAAGSLEQVRSERQRELDL
jgi:plasmid stability protein